MSQNTEEMRDQVTSQVNKSLDELRQLRDEIRVRLHLAGMEARERWNELEPRLSDAEVRVREATEAAADAARATLNDALKAFHSFRESLGDAKPPEPPRTPPAPKSP